MKILTSILAAALSLTACTAQTQKDRTQMTEKKILVAYFSRADENYSVGRIEKGNTKIVAEFIAEQTGAATFHIETAKPYPADYDQCIAVAKKEKEANARPEIKGDVRVEDYDIIFIGTPNWWGEVPMALYTFIEKHDWQGKTVIPFATHEGSGMGGMDTRIQKACKGSTALKSFAIYGHEAQNDRPGTKQKVLAWLKSIGF